MAEPNIILETPTFQRLSRVLELAQAQTDEEVSYSDVIRVLLDMAFQVWSHETFPADAIATRVVKATV